MGELLLGARDSQRLVLFDPSSRGRGEGGACMRIRDKIDSGSGARCALTLYFGWRACLGLRAPRAIKRVRESL